MERRRRGVRAEAAVVPQKINKLVRINAITSALSAKLSDGNLIVLDKLDIEPKTKNMAAVLKALKVESRVLLVLPQRQ